MEGPELGAPQERREEELMGPADGDMKGQRWAEGHCVVSHTLFLESTPFSSSAAHPQVHREPLS